MNKFIDIPGYEGYYQIDRNGNIRSLDRYRFGKKGSATFCQGRPMVCRKTKNGYVSVGLSKNKIYKLWLVHRLVAITFIENPDNLPCVDHINGIRDDNRVENLRWCTKSENLNFQLAKENISKANRKSAKCRKHMDDLHQNCRKSVVIVSPDETIKEYDSIADTEKDGFYHPLVSACCKGKQQSHRGCKCYYREDYYGN